jgi:hypothetical protein
MALCVSLSLQNNIFTKDVANKQFKQDDTTGPASDIPVLLKIGNYFIPRGHIQSVIRFGKGCKIILTTGDEMLVQINYDKVVDMVG